MKTAVVVVSVLAASLLTGRIAPAQKLARDAEMCAKVLKTDKDPERRLSAARELADIAKVKAAYVQAHTGILLEALRSDRDTGVRVGAGTTLLAFAAAPKEVAPLALELLKNDKEPGAVLAVSARLAAAYQAKDAIPHLQALKTREEAKDDPKLRDQRLLQAVNLALQMLMK